VLAHLGVFAGGATAEAAQAVLGQSTPVLAALEDLTDASLALAQVVGGETRFSLLETVREFALEQLSFHGELAETQQRHAEYFTLLAERARPELNGPAQRGWFDRLDRELANVRAALRWCLRHARQLGLRLAAAPDVYWNVRGHAVEGRRWLRDLLQQEGSAELATQAEAFRVASWLAMRGGETSEAQALAEQGQQLFLRLEDDVGLGGCLYILGEVESLRANFAAAQSLLEQSLAVARGCHDAYTEAGALNGLAGVALRLGDHTTAQAYMEQRLAIHRARQDPRNTAGTLHNLGVGAYERGDYESASAYGQASLAAMRELGDTYGIALGCLHQGNTLLALGDVDGAQAHLEEAIAIHRREHATEPLSAPLNVLGKVLLTRGDLAGARACSSEALRLRLEAGDKRGIAVSLKTLATIDHAGQKSERAARLLGAGEAIRERIRAPLPPNAQAEHEQFVASVRAALGDPPFQTAVAAGRELTLEQAVALALE
jgi:tetratricopeptide (TPR) repeat protein